MAIQTAQVRRLQQQVARLEGSNRVVDQPAVSCGVPPLDALLPRGGFSTSGMVEWLATSPGGGARLLSMLAAAACLRVRSGPLLVVDQAGTFYPPAAIQLGIPADRLIWVRPSERQDQVWAIDQGLRCGAIAAVWSPLGSWLDDRDARRFQLAAETGNTQAFFVRPGAVHGEPSHAEVRWYVAQKESEDLSQTAASESVEGSSGREIRATLARCRGGQINRSATFIVSEQGTIDAVSTPPRRIASHRTGSSSGTRTSWGRQPSRNLSEAAGDLAAQLARPATGQRRKNSA
ncbi:ImuA family protein [Roseimaritima multifibrata]|uniref:ImuA family protein n=1 Tax=Roseimaritima multifibrata TaxID=1930274 RepID=UPI0037042C3A